jgi:glycosyltransferase involved in cell wall biosynthesis
VNLEAMTAGKAIVATRVGGVSEIVEDGVNGLLVEGEDADGLVKAIERIAKDKNLRDRLGQAGKKRAEYFTWSAIADQYLKIYNKQAFFDIH